jgi:DNA-directed RNA polymerase I, II, and III subunit RPABC5
MIIPIRCFTCGKVIAGKWKKYLELCAEQKDSSEKDNDEKKQKYFDDGHKGPILDSLGLDKMCCRRHVLTHVDLVDVL